MKLRVWLRTLVLIAVPFVLAVGALRLTTLPWYPTWAYEHAGVPPDPFGIDPAERRYMAQVCIYFLNAPHDLNILRDLRFADGTVAFNERELEHMDDVKVVFDQLTVAGLVALAVGLLAGAVLVRREGTPALWGALSNGGLLTFVALIGVALFMLIAWDSFFVAFHQLFFSGDTWLFPYSDTLIRLFPVEFWQGVGLIVGGLVGVSAFVLALVGRALEKAGNRKRGGAA